MSNLIITIIGIALFVAISAGGIMYVDTAAVIRRQNDEIVKTELIKLIAEYHIYKLNNGSILPDNGSGWTSAFDKPRSPEGTTWSYQSKATNGNGSYFCLSGSFDTQSFYDNTMKKMKENFNSVFVSNACGADPDTEDTSFTAPSFKAFTVWLDSDYVSASIAPPVTFTVHITNLATGKQIYDGDSIMLYENEDFLLGIEISNPDVIATNTDPADLTTGFVCSDMSDGCNSTENRLLKLNATTQFTDRSLKLEFTDGSATTTINVLVSVRPPFSCNSSDPLDNDSGTNWDIQDGYYYIGNFEGRERTAREQLLCISRYQDIIGSSGDPLAAHYVLNSGVTFDVSMTDNKTYMDKQGVGDTTAKDSTYAFLKSASFIVNSNNVDWDQDDVIGSVGDADGWRPLGDSRGFSGRFKGGNHHITNLFVKNNGSYPAGFFGKLTPDDPNNPSVEGLSLKNVHIESSAGSVGALAGLSNDGYVYDCNADGLVISTGDNVGGLIGSVGNTSNIIASFSEADVFGSGGNVGGLIGYMEGDSDVEMSSSSGDIYGGGDAVGGLIGYSNNGAPGESIMSSSASSNVYGAGLYVGGLIGWMVDSKVQQSKSSGFIASPNASVGGIIGFANQTTIEECRSSASVYSGSGNVGGIGGNMYYADINDSYFDGSIESVGSNYGGLIGYSDGSYITHCYAAASDIIGPADNTGGGLIGGLDNLDVTKSYAVNDNFTAIGGSVAPVKDNFCSWSYDITIGCDIRYIPVSIKGQSFEGAADGWDDDVWEDLAQDNPKLEWENEGDVLSEYLWYCEPDDPLAKMETDGDYYLIGGTSGHPVNAKYQLLCISQNQDKSTAVTGDPLKANYRMTVDVPFYTNIVFENTYMDDNGNGGSSVKNDTYRFLDSMNVYTSPDRTDWDGNFIVDHANNPEDLLGWKPIGHEAQGLVYTGTFDGNGHKVMNLYINRPTESSVGMFGSVEAVDENNDSVVDGGIKNLYIETSYVNGGSSSGLLVGDVLGDSPNSLIYPIEKNNIQGAVLGTSSVGGMIGSSYAADIKGNTADVDVIADSEAGGLIGYANDYTVIDSSTTDDGSGNITSIIYSYAEGDVSGSNINSSSNIGGLVGKQEYADSFTDKSYSTGNVAGYSNVGGLIGNVAGSSVLTSYSTSEVYGKNGYAGGLIGLVNSSGSDNGVVSDVYVRSDLVSGGDSIGGLIGRLDAYSSLNNSYSKVTSVSGSGSNVGALVGSAEAVTNPADIVKSYAMHDSLTAVGNWVYDIDNYCSDANDLGCMTYYVLTSIKGESAVGAGDGWSDDIWENLASDTPVFEIANISGLVDSEYLTDVWVCNPADPLLGIAKDVNGYFLIGGGATSSSMKAVDQLLCISMYQNVGAAASGNPLSAKYKLMAHVPFQTNWTLEKTYMDETGNTSTSYSSAYPYINSVSMGSSLSNNEDWDSNLIPGDAGDSSGWLPIGVITNFTGEFNGNGYTISNLYIDQTDPYAGLFGSISGATITNVSLNNAYVSGGSNSALLVGGATNSTITNCKINGSVQGGATSALLIGSDSGSTINNVDVEGLVIASSGPVGALIGSATSSNISDAILESSDAIVDTVMVSELSSYGYVGGLIGQMTGGLVSESSSNASAYSSSGSNVSAFIGGLSGSAQVEKSFSLGYAKGSGVVGGLAGFANDSTISSSYSGANVFASANDAGGLVGDTDSSTITNSYSFGDVEAANYVGGVIGKMAAGYINNSYYIEGNLSGLSNIGSLVGKVLGAVTINNDEDRCEYIGDSGTGVCTVNNAYFIKTQGTPAWSDDVWENIADYKPALEWETPGFITSDVLNLWECDPEEPLSDFEQDGDGYFLIGGTSADADTAKSQLLCISNNYENGSTNPLSSDYKLTVNVVFNSDETTEDWDGDGLVDGNNPTGWNPIGRDAKKSMFTGVFDGNGHSISNLYIKANSNYQGFIGKADNAEIRNLRLSNVDITGYYNVGGLLGYAEGTTVDRVGVTGEVEATSSYGSDQSDVGGIAGFFGNQSSMSEVYFIGSVTGSMDDVGGLIGGVWGKNDTYINDSYFDGSITGNMGLGGIIGYSDNAIVSNVYADVVINSASGLYSNAIFGANEGDTTLSGSYGLSDSLGLNGNYGGNINPNLTDHCVYPAGGECDVFYIQGLSIKADGSDDYIDTDLTWTDDTKMEWYGRGVGTPTDYDKLTGTIDSDYYTWIGYRGVNYYYGLGATTSTSYLYNMVPYDNEYHTFVLSFADNEVSIDDNVYNFTPMAYPTGLPIVFFARLNADGVTVAQNFPFALQYLKIWQGGTLVRAYMPNQSGQLVDTLEGLSYQNQGSGSFVYPSSGWSSSIWRNLGLNLNPTLKNTP